MAKAKRAAENGGTIKVRAIKVGFYGDVRRRVGDVFTLYPRTDTFTELVLDKDGEPKVIASVYGEQRVTEEADKTLTAEEQFSPKWMEKVAADTPERAARAKDVLQEEHDTVLRQRLAGATGDPTGDEDVLGKGAGAD
jgi:hypothetical protein